MLDLESLLDNETLTAFMRGVARKRYHVLLGAGASVGGASRDGRPLPNADELADELRTRFALPDGGGSNLRRLYAAAIDREAKDGSSLRDFFQERFTHTTPPGWMHDFSRIGWQQVWTLNVDDCLERSFGQNEEVAQQRLISVSWTENHRAAREAASELLAVHLHGKASRAHRKDELIFDIGAYVYAAIEQHRWHRLFGDAYAGQPFLIIGASLDAEIDLQAILEQSQARLDHPSIIVLKDIDDLQADEYRRYGLVPVKARADEFFSEIVRLLPTFLSELTSEEAEDIGEVPAEARRFLHQWHHLDPSAASTRDRRHDVFRGHDPRWSDAVSGKLFTRDVRGSLSALADPSVTDLDHLLFVLAGPSFSGKTAILFEAAREFSTRDFACYIFDSETAPDVDAALWWVRRYPKTILIIDNAADFAQDVAELYRRAAESAALPRLLAVERSQRLKHIENRLVLTERTTLRAGSRLSRDEINRLVDVLEANDRAGAITGLPRRQQVDYFKEHDRELFSSMASLERGRGFVEKVETEYDAVGANAQRDLLAMSAVTAHVGYGLPAEIVRSSSGLSVSELNNALDGELGDVLSIQDGVVRLRHRFMGQVLLTNRLSKEKKFLLAVRLAKALAPHVSLEALRTSTIYYRISRGLMGRELLADLFDGDRDAVFDWYEEVQGAFDWNARYWEQRALSAADCEQFEPAFSWARTAVKLHRDSLTLNTVGAVLMRRAVYEARDGKWPSETYELAEQALRESRSHPNVNEYPYETFFSYTLRLVERVEVTEESLRSYLSTTWAEWYVSILGKDPAVRERLHARVEPLTRRWEDLGFVS